MRYTKNDVYAIVNTLRTMLPEGTRIDVAAGSSSYDRPWSLDIYIPGRTVRQVNTRALTATEAHIAVQNMITGVELAQTEPLAV